MLEGSRSIVNRRLLCVSRIEHTIECSNYTLLAKGRASEFYTIFDNETSLPPSETPSPRPGIAIDVRIQSMAIMSSPFLRYKRINLSESIRSDPLFHRFARKTKKRKRGMHCEGSPLTHSSFPLPTHKVSRGLGISIS